jgi:hypothetical protein
MTTPTIFSDKALNPFEGKMIPAGVHSQQVVATVPAFSAPTTSIGLIRFQAGVTFLGFEIASDALGGGATIDVGYVYDDTTGEDDDAFFVDDTVIAAGGTLLYPSDVNALLVGKQPRLDKSGYLTVTITTAATATLGDITMTARFTYDN